MGSIWSRTAVAPRDDLAISAGDRASLSPFLLSPRAALLASPGAASLAVAPLLPAVPALPGTPAPPPPLVVLVLALSSLAVFLALSLSPRHLWLLWRLHCRSVGLHRDGR